VRMRDGRIVADPTVVEDLSIARGATLEAR
jgi:hypothetical protein